MTYEFTHWYKCDLCGKKQTKNPETVCLLSPGPGFACEECIQKGLVPGYSIGKKEDSK